MYLRPRVTLTFDLLTSNVDRFFHDFSVPMSSNSVYSFSKYRVTNKRTDGRTCLEHNAPAWQSDIAPTLRRLGGHRSIP